MLAVVEAQSGRYPPAALDDETDYIAHTIGAIPGSSSFGSPLAPDVYIKTLRRKLHELRSSFSPDLLQLGKYNFFNLSSKDPELQCDDHLLMYLSKLFTKCQMWAETRWNKASQAQDVETPIGPEY
ncbi:hypothetical protein N7466_002106 [Penicillium verhagenii]|uniref:uncharacterized protein n=1 Tax=Penicillium verhagenii TaxID=1562060 RepID=UPI00254598B0|nr:uncharacterized protein N7466_002106 [Penicillium verhagenii]KAJ5938972.1 hypothetical protein N7466_002106 [Penicillium verhagenii]